MLSPVAPPSSIDAIGRYTIERILGVGAMGSVYLAYDTRLFRHVALKVLRAGAQPKGVDVVAASLREARAAGAVLHPNVTAVFDAGEADGRAYIVMEFVPGTPLRKLVGDPRTPLATRLRWLVDIAGALAAAHAVGVVHRDMKPENVLIRDDGMVKVLDFGIARLAAGDDASAAISGLVTWTQEGGFVGTPGYMAPEALRGLAVDGRADQFGWGVVAYELLSGKLPWRCNDTALGAIAAVLTQEPEPLGPEIPAPVAAVIARALAKVPEERFPSLDIAASLVSAYAEPATPSFRLPPEPRVLSQPPTGALSMWAPPPLHLDPRPPTSTLSSAEMLPILAPSLPPPPPSLPSPPPPAPPLDRSSFPSPSPAPCASRPDEPRRAAPPPSDDAVSSPRRPLSSASDPRSDPISPRPGFRPPDFAAPVDVAGHLALLPPSASVKGMFFLDLLGLASKRHTPHDLARLAGIPGRRYVPFRDYPMADNMRLSVAVAGAVHPRLPLGEALRRLGHRALGVVLDSRLGRALFGAFDDPEPFLMHGHRAYRRLIGLGCVSAERLAPGEYRLEVRGMPLFLETYQIGVLESVLHRCHVRGEILIATEGLADATVLVRIRR